MAEKWSARDEKGTIVDDDEFMIIDSEEIADADKNKRVKFSTVSTDLVFLTKANTYDAGIVQNFGTSDIRNVGSIGIGTAADPAPRELVIDASGVGEIANFRMIGPDGNVTQNMGAEFDWVYNRTGSGAAIVDIQVKPAVGSNSNAIVRFGLQSGSTGNNNTLFFNSNGNQVQSQLGSSNSITYFNRHGGSTAIGKQLSDFQLDVNGDIRTTETFRIDSGGQAAEGTVIMASPIPNTFAFGTVTLSGVTGATHSTGVITHPSDILSGDSVTIGTDTFTAGDGTEGTFDVSGDAATDQVNLIALINSVSTTVEAKPITTSTIDISAITLDATTGDAIVFTEIGTSMSVSGSGTLAGGVDVTDEVTLNGLQYSPVTNQLTIPNEGEFEATGVNNNNDALFLDDAINADTRVGLLGDLSSTVSTNTVTVTSDLSGTLGNAVLMSETGSTFTLSGFTLSGGLEADTVTLYGNLTYTAVSGVKTDKTQFRVDDSTGAGEDDNAAIDLADSVNNDTRQGSLQAVNVIGSSLTDTVTLTASVTGEIGDNVLLASSDSGVAGRLETSGANLGAGAGTDGEDADQLIIASGTLGSADRTVTFPGLTADDTFVLRTVGQTLLNKTLNVATNTITGLTLGSGANKVSGASTDLTDSSDLARDSNNLSFFSSTTSLQLKNIISDETGSGALVFGTSPTIVTPVIATIVDVNANEVAQFTIPGVDAVNFLEFASSNTLVAPTMGVGGDDTNIDLDISGKGSGVVDIKSTLELTFEMDANGNPINNLEDPTLAQDAVTKIYDDSGNGVAGKEPVRLASTANVILDTNFVEGDTIDTKTLVLNDRVVLKNQTDPTENGAYLVPAAATATPTRVDDMNEIAEFTDASFFVTDGSANIGLTFFQTEIVTVIGTSDVEFVLVTPSSRTKGTATAALSGTSTSSTVDVSITVVDTLEQIDDTGSWVGSQLSNFTVDVDDGTLTHTGAFTETFYINYSVSGAMDNGSSSPWYCAIRKGGTLIANSQIRLLTGNSSDHYNVSGGFVVELAPSDTIDLVVSVEASITATLSVSAALLSAIQVS